MGNKIKELRKKDANLIAKAKSILAEAGLDEVGIDLFMSGFAIAMTIDVIGGGNLITQEFFSKERLKATIFTEEQENALISVLNQIIETRIMIKKLEKKEEEK